MTAEGLISLGFSAISWVEHYLVHGPGDVQGKPIELDDEFAAFLVKAYALNPDGSRKVRRAVLSRSKGRNKSGFAAMVACFDSMGPSRFDHFATAGEVSDWGYAYDEGEPVGKPVTHAEALCVATEENQTGNTYDAIHYMLHPETCSDALLIDYGKLDVGLTRINLPDGGFIEPVTSSDSSKDGGKSTFIVADETHLWLLPRLKRLHAIMTRNLLKRRQASGWMLETTTMYAPGADSVAEGTHAYAKAVGDGKVKDSSLLFDHKQASEKWNLNRADERMRALREAYGPAAEWMNLEAIADSWHDPQQSESDYRRYWNNQPVDAVLVECKFPPGTWHACADHSSQIEGAPTFSVAVANDRSWACIAAAGLRADDKRHVEVIDNRRGTAWVANRCAELIQSWGGDVFLNPSSPAASLVQDLDDAGVAYRPVTANEMNQACGLLYDEVLEGELRHLDQQVLNIAVAQAVTRPSGDGAWVWSQSKSPVDISPLVAVTIAGWACAESLSSPCAYLA